RDARAHSRWALRGHALPAGGAERDARPLLRPARLGRGRHPHPGAARRPRPLSAGPHRAPIRIRPTAIPRKHTPLATVVVTAMFTHADVQAPVSISRTVS